MFGWSLLLCHSPPPRGTLNLTEVLLSTVFWATGLAEGVYYGCLAFSPTALAFIFVAHMIGRSAFPLLADFPWQVKNMFIFSPGDRGAARLASIWEVVRSLEKLFPGQSEFVRADLMVLVILNGNDYLPKVRGVSFRRCFRSYVRLKGGKHR